jgi:GTP-binding protein SAR1
VWKTYFANADAIVFIVDVADHDRLGEVRGELHRLLSDEAVADIPVVIFGNKIDAVGALQEGDLRAALMVKVGGLRVCLSF